MSCDIRLDFEESNQELDLDFQEKIEVGGGGGISENRVVQIVKQETADLQPQVDEGLSTENKTVVGAINEVNETANKKTTVRVDGQKVDEFNADEKFDKTGGVIDGEVTIEGDLIVKGTTKTVDTETLSVKDNIIVANVDNAPLAGVSGFAVKTGEVDEETQKQLAYGIMYDKQGDGVKIGLGGFDENGDFVYSEGEAQFLATRADNITDGHIPKWDNEKKQFVDSGEKIGDYLKKTDRATIDGQKAGIVQLKAYGSGGLTIDSDGSLVVQAPSKAIIDQKSQNRPITPLTMDYAWKVAATTNTETWTDEDKAKACETIGAVKKSSQALILYGTDANGKQTAWTLRNTNNTKNTIAGRDSNGNIQVGNAINKTDCVNLGYAEDNFVAKFTNPDNNANRRYVLYSYQNGTEDVIQYSSSAKEFAIAQFTSGGNLVVAAPRSDTHAATKKYVDENKGTKLYLHRISHSGGDDILIINRYSAKYTTSEEVVANVFEGSLEEHLPINSYYMNGSDRVNIIKVTWGIPSSIWWLDVTALNFATADFGDLSNDTVTEL